MRKNNFLGKTNKLEKTRTKMFNKIMSKLRNYQDINAALRFYLKTLMKFSKSKGIFFICHNYEYFYDFSKKDIKRLKHLYQDNYLRWQGYFSEGANMIDCFSDMMMNNYGDYKINKGFIKNIILLKTSLKSNYEDGIIFLKPAKEVEIIDPFLPYIYNCFTFILKKLNQNIKSEAYPALYPIKQGEKILTSRFIINDKITLIDLDKICDRLSIEKGHEITYIPFGVDSNISLNENEILTLKNNREVSFDMLIKAKKIKKWLRVKGTYSNNDGDNAIFDGIITEITDLKRNKYITNLREYASKKNYYYTNEVKFEYIINKDEFIAFGNIFEIKANIIPHTIYRFKNTLNLLNLCGACKFKNLLSGQPTDKFEIKLIKNDGAIEYYEIEGTVILIHNIPRRVIGKIINITNRKIRELELIEMEKRDVLTNFYTREAGSKVIEKKLQTKDGIDSLILIDIDDFNILNSEYGYLFGNIIIYELSILIRELFPNKEIIRYGGDDFIIYLNDMDANAALEISNDLVRRVKDIYISSDVEISISVGIVDTEESNDLNELLQIVDQTLLYVKHNGGGYASTYHIIDKETKSNVVSHIENKVDETINSNDTDIVTFALDILSKVKQIKAGLRILLYRIGTIHALQKISVFEYSYSTNEMKFYCGWSANQKYNPEEIIFKMSLNDLEIFTNCIINDTLNISDNEMQIFNDNIRNQISENFINHDLVFHSNNCTSRKYLVVFEMESYKQFWDNNKRSNLEVLANIILTFIIRDYNDQMVQAKTDYLSKMSHEIRTPLSGIIGMTKIAKNVADNPFKINDALEKIDMSSRYLLSLVNNILDLSRIEADKMKINKEPFLLSNLLDDVETLMRVQSEQKNIKFQVIRKFSNRWIIGDTLRISQVIINIIGNAIKFTSEKGHVVFLINEEVIDNKAHIKFTVKDSGIGIKKENTLKIFESFKQEYSNTAREYGGSGLGLSISSSLVKLMGGKLELISEEGKGSEFFFTLIFNYDSKNQNVDIEIKQQEDELAPAIVFVGKRVLLVEDDDLNADIVKTLLENIGFKVEIAINGKVGVEMYAKSKINYYDIILMDIRMPVMNGIEATTFIRGLSREDSLTVPIIAMTANAFEDDISESVRCGMRGHLTKPIDIKILHQELKRTLENK